MLTMFVVASVWLGLAVVSTILSNRLKISMALMEITVGAIAGLAFAEYFNPDFMQANSDWIKFIAGTGAVVLTFLAGAELDYHTIKDTFKEVTVVGFIGFLSPFAGSALIAHYILGWSFQSSLLAGVALSTTSMAVVYAVMIEYGFNKTKYGKGILGACFVNDLGTVIASAVVPTLIANKFFLPEHLLEAPMADEEIPQLDGLNGVNNNH